MTKTRNCCKALFVKLSEWRQRRGLYLQPFKSKDGWRFRLRARNNKILMSSEAYSRKAKMRQSLELVANDTGWKIKPRAE